ncbi:MAG: SagB/ThcOx family dehydrogenase [Promethearchaeia archaeon]
MDALKEPSRKGEKSLEFCISHRESRRSFSNKKVSREKISQLLWAGQGKINGNRAAPSAGATYPLYLYMVKNGKEFLKYDPEDHKLDLIKEKKNFDIYIARDALSQMFISEAPLIIIICANYQHTTRRYGKRGRRYVLIEVGHAAQNILLQAEALDLTSVPIGAFKDSNLKKTLELPDATQPLYILPIGYPE